MFLPFKTVSPAPYSAVLEAAGPYARMRRDTLWQARNHPSTAIYLNDDVLAVAFFRAASCGRVEMALSLHRSAAAHMRALIRLAHLTLGAMSQSHVIYCRIRLATRQGRRMAMLTGFRQMREGSTVWIFERR